MLTQAMGFARVESGRMVAVVAEVAIGMWVLFLFALAVAWAPVDRRFGSQVRHDREMLPEADRRSSRDDEGEGVEDADTALLASAGARSQVED